MRRQQVVAGTRSRVMGVGGALTVRSMQEPKAGVLLTMTTADARVKIQGANAVAKQGMEASPHACLPGAACKGSSN